MEPEQLFDFFGSGGDARAEEEAVLGAAERLAAAAAAPPRVVSLADSWRAVGARLEGDSEGLAEQLAADSERASPPPIPADFWPEPRDVAEVLEEQRREQPVTSGIAVGGLFRSYKTGVFDDPGCGSAMAHSVLLVGYNKTASPPYFIAKNSWGPNWG